MPLYPGTPAYSFCFGGSFDPPHLGHLDTARHAARTAGFDGVRLVVAGRSPFKDGGAASPEQRVALCRAAVTGDPFFFVDDRETHRDGPSYTADTASQLRDELSELPTWLIGADLLPGLPRWHRAAELLAVPPTLLRFAVMRLHACGGSRRWASSSRPSRRRGCWGSATRGGRWRASWG